MHKTRCSTVSVCPIYFSIILFLKCGTAKYCLACGEKSVCEISLYLLQKAFLSGMIFCHARMSSVECSRSITDEAAAALVRVEA